MAHRLLRRLTLERRKVIPPLDATRTSPNVGADLNVGAGVKARDLERLVDVMYAPATTFESWRTRVAAAATRAFSGALEASVIPVGGSPTVRVDDSSPTLRVCGALGESLSIVLSVRRDRNRCLVTYERELLGRIALHLENAASLRTASSVRGTASWNGRTFVVNDRYPQRLWLDLTQGRASLAPAAVDTTRYFILNAPATWARHRALSETETRIVMQSLVGVPFKAVAYDLGLSTPSVSRALAAAAAKIGVRAPFDLLRIASRLAVEDNHHELAEERLTKTEREVLALVLAGLSNRAIAELRGRSMRTIANQVASLLRKTGCSSRRALATSRRTVGTFVTSPLSARRDS